MNRLENIRETLDTEIKGWLDPEDPTDQARIARSCIALRNHGGGILIIGFDDNPVTAQPYNLTKPIEEAYHADTIQRCVAKYAKPQFDVTIDYEEKAGQKHPIITIPTGVEFPVINKSADGSIFKRQNTVITRVVSSNNTVSSSEPQTAEDWNRLIQTCFDNREANIGQFFRRHIGAIQQNVSMLDSRSPSVQLLDESHAKFMDRLDRRPATALTPARCCGRGRTQHPLG